MKNESNLSFLFTFVFVGFLGIIILGYYLVSNKSIPSLGEYMKQNETKISLVSIITPNGIIRASIATSSEDQEKGLSGRASLPDREGMLFIFESAGVYPFWMKDMLIPLDIVWINQEKEVIGINSNISPDSYPTSFSSLEPALYVLELNAGAVEKFGIATGTPLTFVI